MIDTEIHDILTQLRRVANALEKMSGVKPTGPDYRRTLAEYPTFDWSSIGAEVVSVDQDGPTCVFCDGSQWTRRSPQNKFGEAIWFSRSAGHDDEGEVIYLRLITFKAPAEVDPLGRKVKQELTSQQPAPAKPTQAPAKPAPAQPQAPANQHAVQSIAKPETPIITYASYLEMAGKPRFNLAREAAIRIAEHFGVTDPGADYTLPAKWLPYFAEAKAAGFKLSAAILTVDQKMGDFAAALQSIRVQATGIANR